MKVICIEEFIDNCDDEVKWMGRDVWVPGSIKDLISTGKIYDVIEESFISYRIIDDKGNDSYYSKNMFKKLSDIRDEKLNELGV